MYKRLDSYEEVHRFWNTARFKDKGKPIGSWGRLFKTRSREDTFPVEDRFDFHVNHYSGGDYDSSNCFATL